MHLWLSMEKVDTKLLAIYNKDSKCPKCGHNKIGAKFVPAAGQVRVENIILETDEEIMQRICKNCKYSWFEKPISVSAAKPKNCGSCGNFKHDGSPINPTGLCNIDETLGWIPKEGKESEDRAGKCGFYKEIKNEQTNIS